MEKVTDLESKYQKLAAEYSKVRSQATVLKKAVLEEQAKNNALKDTVKLQEQKIRKHDQEMESLTFRNEQLAKRISVLQQELQLDSGKKTKGKFVEAIKSSDTSVLDEELQKKILENAQLVSSMVDKDLELSDYRERFVWLEKRHNSIEKEFQEKEHKYLDQIAKLKVGVIESDKKLDDIQQLEIVESDILSNKSNESQIDINFWKEESERWRTECEVLRLKPQSNEQLTSFYESHIRELLELKQTAHSEAKALWSENVALYSRLENLIRLNKDLEISLEKKNEELLTTIENYKSQLDAMTEHLAAQNDKITKQCDEIQALKHRIASKK